MLNTIKDGNKVKIEGILSEIDLKNVTYKDSEGNSKNAISGNIKIRVDTVINGEETCLEVPVAMFSNEKKNNGDPNPAYKSLYDIMTTYVSIAASDIDRADRVRITSGQISMNEYYNNNEKLVSFPRITASFVSKIKKEECKPCADFTVVFMVGQKGYELDREGIETDRYKVVGMIPQYGENIDVVPFYAVNPGVIQAVSTYWNEGDTVKATGKLNFSSKTETFMQEVDFGEPVEETRTISISDLVITGGSSTPLEGDFAINYDDVTAALEKRKAKLATMKDKSAKKVTTNTSKAPAANAGFKNLGF